MRDIHHFVIQSLTLGQVGFAAGLALCFIIKPQFLHSQGGLSNYGVTTETILFFTFAFLSAAVGTFLAARRLSANTTLKWSLYILAMLFAAVLASTYPYKFNGFYDTLHQDISILFGVYGLALGAFLVAKRHDTLNLIFFAVQVAASAATVATILGAVHLLFVSELLAGIGFSVVLVRGVVALLETRA